MRVAAIVPAYNEEQTIGTVVEALLQCQLIDELIVVSDGSDDHTVDVASKYPVKVIELKENVGKGGAMKAGASATTCDVLLFVDADLVGLNHEHIKALLEPVLSRRTAMSIGVFSEGRRSTDLARSCTVPFGQGLCAGICLTRFPIWKTALRRGSDPDPVCREEPRGSGACTFRQSSK